ncbi:MAG: crossover junction endodeoxyribonuclease RuvC [bacterium]|nr:crossover junction endodeoxyribonuclease RuvC [Bacillota bacterium]HHW55572.1 crossover junction endodeoxyribonuclease RuvC [Bacillota bacterium]
MLVLGIDPGTATTGYGIIEVTGHEYSMVDYGCIKTSPRLGVPQRLEELYRQMGQLLTTYKPAVVAVEELFFNKNVRTALAVGQARGVVLLAAAAQDIEVVEYTPLQVKQGVVGYGRATKKQVQEMVKILLKLDKLPRPDDAADALAIAICYAHELPFLSRKQRMER